MAFKKVALAGASGYLGRGVLDHLLTIPTLSQITVLTHSSSTVFPSSPILRVVSIPSYQDIAALTAALEGHDLLVSLLSSQAQKEADESLISAAVAAGVKRYMPAEYTVDVLHPRAIAIGGSTVLAAKLASARQLQSLAEEGQLEFTTLVTGAFLDFWFENTTPVIDPLSKTITLLDGGEKKMTGVTTSFIAKCVGAIVVMPEEATKNQRIRIAEVVYTGKDLLRTLEEVTDTKWTVTEGSTDDALKVGLEAGKRGDMRGFYLGNVIKINFEGEGAGYFEEGMQWQDGAVQRQSLKEIADKSMSHLNAP